MLATFSFFFLALSVRFHSLTHFEEELYSGHGRTGNTGWSITGHQTQKHSHLGAIHLSQFTYRQVFGRWDET